MSTEHGHAHVCSSQTTPDQNVKQAKCSKTMKLSIMLVMIFVFFIVEVVVGQLTNSITLIADSFHMLSDFIALCIGLVSVRVRVRGVKKKPLFFFGLFRLICNFKIKSYQDASHRRQTRMVGCEQK
jgi:Co/Zn/Cd efflux system component